MPFDKKQTQILQEHLRGRSLTCPVCQNQNWQLVEVMTIPVHNASLFTSPNPLVQKVLAVKAPGDFTAGAGLAGSVDVTFPVAVVSCSICYFVMQFAWRPIVAKDANVKKL